MRLQIIKSVDGKDEYVLLPIDIYQSLKNEIKEGIAEMEDGDNDYVTFDPADYVDNPVALVRIRAHLTQKELAERMGVSQAYISKIEGQKKVGVRVLEKVNKVIKNKLIICSKSK